MHNNPVLYQATFIRRYKRFFADVVNSNGELITVHCPNTGSMRNCQIENSPCWYSLSDNPKRKLVGTLEIVTTSHGRLAGINTLRANRITADALRCKKIDRFAPYDEVFSEVAYGKEKSRIDFLLKDSAKSLPDCYIEVKNVTLDVGDGIAEFPDSPTSRGVKHLRELITMSKAGYRAVLLFCVQLNDINCVKVAGYIDPEYQKMITLATQNGVEIIAWQAQFDGQGIYLNRAIEFSH
ncbi:MAG TPA: DNA/RNA nuclease SfsA [Porticoccaceae bacterium]|nr:DNA/RNA nuclease SfsA [Porticoccaceae bacterium]